MVLKADKVADVLISFFLDLLISKESNENRLIQTELFYALGNKIVQLYIHKLYNDSLSNTEEVKLTLSQWKRDNKNLIGHLTDSPTIVGVGGNLA